MKLTAQEFKRLMELMGKDGTKLNDAEKAELTALRAKADAVSDDESMSAEDVKKTVETAVKAAIGDSKALTVEQVKTIVDAAVAGIKPGAPVDQKAIVTDVVEQVKAALKPGISAEDVKGIVETAIKGIHAPSKMVHGGDSEDVDIEFPIAHRSGNLSVAQKQLLNVMTGKSQDDGISETQLRSAEQRSKSMENRLMHKVATKAITTTGSGTGLEWMNTTLSSQLLQRMYLESKLVAALTPTEVQMPTNPFNYPLGTTRPTFRLATEGSAPAASQGGSAGLALNAKKLTGIVDYSYEADEDSIIAILPKTMTDLGDAAAAALEDAIVNGDTAATHQDSDSHALGATHSGKMFDGIRKLALAQAALKISLASGGISNANVGAMKKLLGKWGLNPNNLIIVTGVAGYNDFVDLPETLTAEKTGNAATARILTGLAPSLKGMDIIPSAAVREDLNATGVYDATTTTKGSLFIIWKPGWIQGIRRGFTVETDSDKKAQTRSVIASFRRDFKPIESLANTKAAVIGYNFNSGAA